MTPTRRDFRPSVQRFAEPQLSRGLLLVEKGVAGDTLSDGLPVDPYNPSLDGRDWHAKVDEMRRSGGHIATVEAVISYPIMASEWHIDGGDKALRELLEANLLDATAAAAMSTTWPDIIRRCCLAPLYGTWAFEKVFQEHEGALVWRRLADRLPRSIERYLWDGEGAIAGVLQKGTNDDGDEIDVEVPIAKLLLFPFRREGRNWHGLSVLRPAYLHWFCIQTLYRIANVGLEHSLVGVPIGKLPSNYTEADKKAFDAILAALQRHEAARVLLPPGYEIEDGRKAGGSDAVGFLPYIEHHARWIPRTALASFVTLGDGAGSHDLADDLVDFFLMAWDGWADEICASFNRHGIRQLVELNAPGAGPEAMPKLVHAPVGQMMKLRRAAGFLQALLAGQLLVPDAAGETEAFFRDGLGLPERDARKEGAAPTPPAALPPGETTPGAATATPTPDSPTEPEEPLQAAERRSMRFGEADVRTATASVRSDRAVALDGWQAMMEPRLAAILEALLQQVDVADGDPGRLARVAVPAAQVAETGELVALWLAEARQAAQATAGTVSADNAPTAADQARGLLTAGHLAEAARFELVSAALAGESLEQLAQRYAAVVDVRLRNDLAAGAQAVAEEVNDAGL